MEKKSVLAIIGSASEGSTNEKLIEYILAKTCDDFDINIFNRLKELPHFDPRQSTECPRMRLYHFITLFTKQMR